MISRRTLLAGGAALAALPGCGASTTAKAPHRPDGGERVSALLVMKERRRLYLLHDQKVVREFGVALGRDPVGHKEREGDGRTPEGVYHIDRRNPRSRYHLALGISYPSPEDIARAEALGVDPGGDIFIHGQPAFVPSGTRMVGDWTAGCIAVSNREMEELWTLVADGTPVVIRP
jgi:murein L,D-transpeptidase YafK